jgi:hypothetical protein
MTTKQPQQKILSRNSDHRGLKQTKPQQYRKYQNTGEEKTRNHRAELIQLHTTKPFNNKNNEMAGIIKYLSILTLNVNGLNFLTKIHHLANMI